MLLSMKFLKVRKIVMWSAFAIVIGLLLCAFTISIVEAWNAYQAGLEPIMFQPPSGYMLLTVTTVTGSGSVVADFGVAVTAWLNLVVDLVIAGFAGVIPVFWVAEYGFSIYGLLLMFGLAVGFVGLALGFIRGLIQK